MEIISETIEVRNHVLLPGTSSGESHQALISTDGERKSMKSFFKGILEAQGMNPGDKVLPMWIAKFAAATTETIQKLFGLKSRPPVAPLMIRLMGNEFSVSDEKARKELGYTNRITIEEGIEELRRMG